MAESKDGSNKRSGPDAEQEDRTNPRQTKRLGKQEKVTFVKGPGHDWVVAYQFVESKPDEMLVFGCMTAEKALEEARFSLNGVDDMNVGTYEIFAVTRLDKQ